APGCMPSPPRRRLPTRRFAAMCARSPPKRMRGPISRRSGSARSPRAASASMPTRWDTSATCWPPLEPSWPKDDAPADFRRPARATGYVEATEVRVAADVGGRLLDVKVAEGDRVAAGDVIARIDSADAMLALQRATAEREQAAAQLSLLRAGSRSEDIRQAAA